MMKRNINPFNTIFTKILVSFLVAIIFTFTVLAIVYFRIVTNTTQKQKARQLEANAQALSKVISEKLTFSRYDIRNSESYDYITFTARASGALIWIVSEEGEIIYDTAIPIYSRSKLSSDNNKYYRINKEVLRKNSKNSYVNIGNYQDFFEPNETWITIVSPFISENGNYAGEVQMHYHFVIEGPITFILKNGLWIAFTVSFAVALLLIILLSRTLSKPIRKLILVANRVYQGDYTARVTYKGKNGQVMTPKLEDQTKDVSGDDVFVLGQTLNTLISQFENREQERKDFMSSVAHDLRTPLTSINGFVNGMIDGTIPTENYERYLKIVKQEIKRLQQLINTLFEITLLENKKIQLQCLDIYDFIKKCGQSLESLFLEKDINLQYDFNRQGRKVLLVNMDAESMQRVILNLLTNAIRFTPEHGNIKISVRDKGEKVEIWIEDDGLGIPEEERIHVFDRFYKVDKARNSKGSGLGLYICRSILNAHGQKISAGESSLGGAKFIFTLDKS